MYYLSEQTVFLAGFILFLFAAIWFFVNRNRSVYYRYASIVVSITTLAYSVLLSGGFVAQSASGLTVYYTRWLFYIVSCSLLMITISKELKMKQSNLMPVLILNGLVMMTGAVAAVIDQPMKWIIFSLGCLFFTAQLVLLFEQSAFNPKTTLLRNYIMFGWAMFPLVFILAPEGLGVLNNALAAVLYLVLDLYAKVFFYFDLERTRNK